MADLISREAALAILHECGGDEIYPPNMIEMRGRMLKLTAVDAMEVAVIEKWLYEIAMNNAGCPVPSMAAACEIIISRLDGLRRFAGERGEDDA